MMKEEQIEEEARDELRKEGLHLAMDIIREANTLPAQPASERENLDLIKHLIKRLAVHQITLDDNAKRTNRRLFWLSVIMALGAGFQVLAYFLAGP